MTQAEKLYISESWCALSKRVGRFVYARRGDARQMQSAGIVQWRRGGFPVHLRADFIEVSCGLKGRTVVNSLAVDGRFYVWKVLNLSFRCGVTRKVENNVFGKTYEI